MLKDFGGTILVEHDVHESFSGDGLIAACFGKEPTNWKEPPISLNRYSTSLFRNPLYDLVSQSLGIDSGGTSIYEGDTDTQFHP